MDWSRVREALRQGCVDPFHLAKYHGGKGGGPPAPDYQKLAQQQSQANIESSKLSNPNIITPYGQQTVSYSGGGQTFDESGYNKALQDYNRALSSYQPQPSYMGEGSSTMGQPTGPAPVKPNKSSFFQTTPDNIPTVTQTLSPESQKLFDQYMRIDQGLGGLAEQGLGYVGDVLNKPFDQSMLPQRTVDAGQTGQDAIMARLQPSLERQREQIRTQLYGQGVREGSEAYDQAMTDQGQRENDLLSQAALQGISIGDTARDRAIQEQEFFRTEPLNILNSLRSSAPVQMPQFQGYQGGAAPAPIFQAGQAGHNAAMQNYGVQQGGNNAMMGGLATLGGAAMMAF